MVHERQENGGTRAHRVSIGIANDQSELATAGSWRVPAISIHRKSSAKRHILIDPEACLSRATALISVSSPSPENLAEARQLLEIVDRRLPERHWTTNGGV